MFSSADTIVAIATPPGRGALGVVRLSGPDAHRLAIGLFGRDVPLVPRYATLTTVSCDPAGGLRDQAIATYFPAPASYTGDEVVEISAHGSPVILRGIVAAAVARGARLAEPGEFTLRAYLNGRLELLQAEAVADLIDAVTPLQARAAFDQLQGTLTGRIATIDETLFDLIAGLEASIDFPDEGYHFLEPADAARAIADIQATVRSLLDSARRGRLVREGVTVAITGRPNVGKSSLFNALAGAGRAIVTDEPGTTRDLVSEVLDLDNARVTLVDSAGIRETDSRIEQEGVARARRAREVADLVLVVLDGSQPLGEDDVRAIDEVSPAKRILVANKSDLPAAWRRDDCVSVAARTGEGLDRLHDAMLAALEIERLGDVPAVTNVRHEALLRRTDAALDRALASALRGAPEELVLADLQEARQALEEVRGRRGADDLLVHIFERFCIGK